MKKTVLILCCLPLLSGCTQSKMLVKKTAAADRASLGNVCVLQPVLSTRQKSIPGVIPAQADALLWNSIKPHLEGNKIFHYSQLRKTSALSKIAAGLSRSVSRHHFLDMDALCRAARESGFQHIMLPSIQYLSSFKYNTGTVDDRHRYRIAGAVRVVRTADSTTVAQVFFSNKNAAEGIDAVLSRAFQKLTRELFR